MKRLFVAIKLIPNENFLKTYYFLKSNLNSDIIKWVEPGIMHLTLKFLGETPNEDIPKIDGILNNFAASNNPINLIFDKVGVFGSSYDPKIIWLGITDNEKIKNMGIDLLNIFHSNGYEKDRQNFVPHLTIARVKKLVNKKHFQEIINKVKTENLQNFSVKEIILFQSILKPNGPVYLEIGKYKLG